MDQDSIFAVRENGGVYIGVHTWTTYAITGTENVASSHFLSLAAPYPNPVTASATVRYTLESNGTVSLKLVDILGRTVALVDESRREAGAHTIALNTESLRSGTYFLRLSTPEGLQLKPLAVVR